MAEMSLTDGHCHCAWIDTEMFPKSGMLSCGCGEATCKVYMHRDRPIHYQNHHWQIGCLLGWLDAIQEDLFALKNEQALITLILNKPSLMAIVLNNKPSLWERFQAWWTKKRGTLERL